jgi:transporter family protein
LIFSPVFTLLISALFLGEIPSARGIVGVGLMLIGAYWLNRNSSAGWLTPFKSLTLTSGVGLVLLAGLFWAITPLFEKTAIRHTYPESPSFAAFIATILLTFILTPLVMRRDKSAITKLSIHRRDLLSAGLIAGVAPVLGYTAFSLGPVGYVTTLFRLSTLMTVIWSYLFLNERGIAQRLPASFVMVIGAILITT